MNARRYGRSVTLLVWTLVSIGLLAGAVSNALVGWTLLHLNRERVRGLEEEKGFVQGTARIQRLGQEVRAEIDALLQGRPPAPDRSPAAELAVAARDLRGIHPEPLPAAALDDLESAARGLGGVRERAEEWLRRYRPVARDLDTKFTLNRARALLEKLRAGAETLEGRRRLEEALLLRRLRTAPEEGGAEVTRAVLMNQLGGRARALREVRTELTELSRVVETLAGENRLDHLVDLKDNQLKPLLERLEDQLQIVAGEGGAMEGLTPRAATELREILFGRGHAVVREYQTIRVGEGGLYRLAGDSLSLAREKDEMEGRARELYARIEAVHPILAARAVERGRTLTRHAEESLTRGLQILSLASVLFLGGFLGLGGVISRKVRRQVVALGRLQRQKELILDSAGEGIVGIDREGGVAFVNPAAERLLGWNPRELKGRPHRDVLRPLRQDGSLQDEDPLREVLNAGAILHRDDELLARRDGVPLPVEYTASPMRGASGEIEGAVVTLLDITLRKEAEAALQRSYLELDELNRSLEAKVAERTRELELKHGELLRAQEELARAERLAAIGSLAAGVAHEINNPAAIIRGNAEILRRKLLPGLPGGEEAAEILESTERISRITRSLLIFAREQSLRTEEVQLNALLGEILAQAPHHVTLGRVRVEAPLDPHLLPLAGDREKLRQVFTNLVINALEAMAGEGVLTVSTFREENAVAVRVADTGPGFAPEERARIFHPFFTTKRTGTGLGLSVSYGIVQSMGGVIEVESERGAGAVFTVRLPVD